ncbi:hypothetical protein QJS10_CPB18g00055 [Acorus calamus]|uniref:Uncharacterized protein n=1 Tax=Acorus calamus TaxID=4465 RepID=A0AAV9CMI5_ACOCL|nr:hypothetical protein QJS10_CPB18g00055 [Acorus calamus]
MEWRKSYLDVILVPLGLAASIAYHSWLWHKVKTQPQHTMIGINASARRLWVASIMKDNGKKTILAVQTLRNTIMGATLMALTSVLLSAAIAAMISSKYTVKNPIFIDNSTITTYGAHGDFTLSVKYVTLLLVFVFAFVCHSLSIRFINRFNHLIIFINAHSADSSAIVECMADLLERGFAFNVIGSHSTM